MRKHSASCLTLSVVAAGALSLSLGACRHDDTEVRHSSSAQHSSSASDASASSEIPPSSSASAPPSEAANPVQREMRLLLAALQGSVSAIADDDLARVPALIHGVHGAREATDAALEDGSYRPPKNPDQLEAFKAMDSAFHAELITLVKAARADDLAATTTQLGKVLSQCKGCHVVFRELPPKRTEPKAQTHQGAPAQEAHE